MAGAQKGSINVPPHRCIVPIGPGNPWRALGMMKKNFSEEQIESGGAIARILMVLKSRRPAPISNEGITIFGDVTRVEPPRYEEYRANIASQDFPATSVVLCKDPQRKK